MTQDNAIFEALKDHLVGRGIEAGKIALEAHLSKDLDLDSLDTMELTLGMEERFGVEIPDAELETLATVGDAVELIERKLSVTA